MRDSRLAGRVSLHASGLTPRECRSVRDRAPLSIAAGAFALDFRGFRVRVGTGDSGNRFRFLRLAAAGPERFERTTHAARRGHVIGRQAGPRERHPVTRGPGLDAGSFQERRPLPAASTLARVDELSARGQDRDMRRATRPLEGGDFAGHFHGQHREVVAQRRAGHVRHHSPPARLASSADRRSAGSLASFRTSSALRMQPHPAASASRMRFQGSAASGTGRDPVPIIRCHRRRIAVSDLPSSPARSRIRSARLRPHASRISASSAGRYEGPRPVIVPPSMPLAGRSRT